MTANELIQLLRLEPLPGEGGYYRQTFKDPLIKDVQWFNNLPSESRSISTAIYFLITADQFSALHRLPQSEVFHFYLGDAVEMLQLDENGVLKRLRLGQNIALGERLQTVVPPKIWQGTRIISGGKWALMGATTSPGFEFQDMELADRSKLLKCYPEHTKEILALTHGPSNT